MLRSFIIFALLFLSSMEDLKSMEVSDSYFLLILLCAEGFTLSAIIRFFFVAFVYFCLLVLTSLLGKDVPIGMADAKLMAALAFSLGLDVAFIIFAAASLLSGIFAAFILVIKKDPCAAFPFVPFIFLGFLIYLAEIV